jgi:hypothetical protein
MAPEPMGNEEGGGLGKKVATGVAVGLATTAAQTSRSRAQTSRSRAKSSGRRASSTARNKAKSSTSRTRTGANRTKEQLYQQAKRLNVKGRSKMNKAQLQRAVARRAK